MLLFHAAGTTALTVAGLEVPHARLSPNSRALDGVSWPEAFPYSKKDLTPDWDGKDGMFYALPKLGHHAGEECRSSLTKFYECALPPSGTGDVLDLCSSFTSHYPDKYKAKRCVALGLNALELAVNPSKTEWRVQDLNENPTLPYDSESFDVITNSLSVDYLTSPLEVFGEMHRVLRPGGLACMAFTNRCFPMKVVPVWKRPFTEAAHAQARAARMQRRAPASQPALIQRPNCLLSLLLPTCRWSRRTSSTRRSGARWKSQTCRQTAGRGSATRRSWWSAENSDACMSMKALLGARLVWAN